MAYTQSQLDTLEAAIATGAREVDYGDKKVVYSSLGDMLKIRDLIRGELGIAKLRRAANPIHSKGL